MRKKRNISVHMNENYEKVDKRNLNASAAATVQRCFECAALTKRARALEKIRCVCYLCMAMSESAGIK